MLKQLRDKKTAKKIWILLAIIILPAFVLWGSGSLVRDKGESGYAGRIFGKKIDFLKYKDALDAARNQMIIQYGEDLAEIQKNVNLESMAWERLLLLFEAERRKIKATDKEVIEQIREYPFFQRKGGFDNAIYAQMIQYVFRTQPRIFEEQTRENIMLAKLFEEITKDVKAQDKDIREAYRKSNEQVSLNYIISQYADFTKEISPFEGQLREYFSKNAIKFKQPLSFNLEYIALLADGQDEAALKERVKKIAGRLNKNAQLDKVAKEFGLEAKETGFFGQSDAIPGIGWSPQILAMLSKAKAGEMLPFIYNDKSYYIIRLKQRREPAIPYYEEVKEKVRESFVREQAEDLAKKKIENCLKKLKEEHKIHPKVVNFEKAAKNFGLKTGSTDLFNYGSYIDGVGASDTFWTIAQNLKEEEFSDIIYMPSGFYIIRLKSRMGVDEDKFAAEKEEFSKRLLAQKKTETFYSFVLELKKKAQLF